MVASPQDCIDVVLLTGDTVLVEKDANVLHVYNLLPGTHLLKCFTHSNGTVLAKHLPALRSLVMEVTFHVYDEAGHPFS